jgi:hypothetical protein
MPSFSKVYFLTSFVNNSSIVKSTKLDSTIKAIINNYKKIDLESSSFIIDYLNTLRIIYYLARLKYYNSTRYSSTLSKYILYYLYYFI